MSSSKCPRCEKDRGVADVALNWRCYACGTAWHMCYDAAPSFGPVPRPVFNSDHSGIMCHPAARGIYKGCKGC
jgi:hypothetical protein